MFRTELTLVPETNQLARTARVLTMGSCFADSMGARLVANKVDTLVNPFGTVFQPLALAQLLRAAAGEEVDWQQHLVEARGRWQSYDLHGSVGADSPVELLQTIQELVRHTGEFVRQADVVLLTLGTAWAYRLRETGELVSNCHKQSADLFVRELLTPEEIINALAETHAYLRRINPKVRFVLTVSPVRHLKDTLPLNSVSKAVLRVATHIVSDLLPDVAYFPAYELLVDDLRDYRFYASDMLHPSEVAEDYIWEKFARTYFDAEFERFRKEWTAIQQSLGHRPLHAGAPEHRQFLESTLQKLEQLSLRKVEVGTELEAVRSQLATLPAPQVPPLVEDIDGEERVDIGAADEVITDLPEVVEAVPTRENRAPRLSPEEFRSQRANRDGRTDRGRRDGRGKSQPRTPTENEQFQSAAAPSEQSAETSRRDVATEEAADEIRVVPVAEDIRQEEPAAVDATGNEDAALDGAKKKKRRSRGGAKRTARKNALRLAAGDLPLTLEQAAEAAGEATGSEPTTNEIPSGRPTSKKSSVIAKSVPVKRGGRRNEPGRVPRAELFAAPPTPVANPEEPANVDAELPTLALATAALAVPDALGGAVSIAKLESTSENPRGRNRRKKGATASAAAETPRTGSPTAAIAETPKLAAGTAAQLSGDAEPTPLPEAERSSQPDAVPLPASPEGIVPPATQPAAPRRNSRTKARAASGARAEKPAIDTPVVPVPDASVVRTQVAGGRMTGNSASLIASVPAKKAAPKKAAGNKTAGNKTAAAKAPAQPAEPKAAKKPTRTPATATPSPAPAAAAAPAAVPSGKKAVIAKPKPASKPKTAAPKAKPAKTKPQAAPGPVASKPAAPKPSRSKKPAKPA